MDNVQYIQSMVKETKKKIKQTQTSYKDRTQGKGVTSLQLTTTALLKCGTWVSEISLASWKIQKARRCKNLEDAKQKGRFEHLGIIYSYVQVFLFCFQ